MSAVPVRQAARWLEQWILPQRRLPLWVLALFSASCATAAASLFRFLSTSTRIAGQAQVTYSVVFGISVLVWMASIRIQDVSIVDIWWGLGFVTQAWCGWLQNNQSFESFFLTSNSRQMLLVGLVTIWGFRLAGFLLVRKVKEGWVEDVRYMQLAMPLCRRGSAPPWMVNLGALFQIFLLQAALVCLVGVPLMLVTTATTQPGLGWLDLLGCLFWGVGFVFEAGADFQLQRFRAEPANKGEVLSTGFFALTRHPNYFGDFCIWVGFFWIGCAARPPWESVDGVNTCGSIFLMFVLLRFVSGAGLMDSCQSEVKPKYREYIRRSSCFFPWPTKYNPTTKDKTTNAD